MKAKKFLEDKQTEHFNKFGVYADTNSKMAEWMEEYASYVLSVAAEKIDKMEVTRYDTHKNINNQYKEAILNCLKN